jgi:ferredoxin-NADP reductase
MTDYQSTLLGRTEVAKGTMAFQFDKPNNFVFKAGQYINLTLSESQPDFGPSDSMTHTFSIVSSRPTKSPGHDPHARYSVQTGIIQIAGR